MGDDATASRHHFILEANRPDAVVRDLGSLNGTWVNGWFTNGGGAVGGRTKKWRQSGDRIGFVLSFLRSSLQRAAQSKVIAAAALAPAEHT
jgi:hypothetical protein